MKERPILFSGPMVRAILDGSKTQTRRVIKPQPDAVEIYQWASGPDAGNYYDVLRCYNPPARFQSCASGWSVNCPGPFKIPGQPGDRLWIRECCHISRPLHEGDTGSVEYRADYADEPAEGIRWRPSIHMPRWASRITLEIVSVRVERLQEISRGDAMAEGCPIPNMASGPDPRHWYEELWNSINGSGSWEANPFVWVVEFKRIKPAKTSCH